MSLAPSPAAGLIAVAVLVIAGCSKEKTFDPPDREERLADAERRFRELTFDTITWASDAERAQEGNALFAARCRDCHGTLGRGGTAYAQNRGLEVPSLVEENWRYAGAMDSVRHRVFVGHRDGMPTWGVAGITPREIDAVAFYVLNDLRPEILGPGG